MDNNKLEVKVSFIRDEIGIITMKGELSVFTQEFDLLNKEIMAYTKMGIYRFIVELSSLTYIDSSGIGILMRLASKASKNDTMVCVICNQPQIMKILTVSKVDKIIRIVQSVDEGLNFYNTTTQKQAGQS